MYRAYPGNRIGNRYNMYIRTQVYIGRQNKFFRLEFGICNLDCRPARRTYYTTKLNQKSTAGRRSEEVFEIHV